LANEPVEVGVGGSLNIEVATADIIDGFIIDHEGTVRVFEGGMGGEDRVVGFDNSGSNLRSGVDGEFKLGFLSVINRKSLHQEGSEARSGASTE